MKFSKQKRHRRAVKFFSVCFGFREPFKVLCDGTFVHHLLTNKLLPANEAIAKCLSASVKLFTTQCCLVELRKLGSDFSQALEAAQQLAIARCDHGKKAADECVTDVIGEKNSDHFFVASQDAHLRRRLQEVPGVPLIFGLRNALFLEKPSTIQRQFVKSAEEKRMHMTDKEKELFEKRAKSLLADDDEKSPIEVEGLRPLQSHNTRKHSSGGYRLGVNDKPGPQFKRKKPKAPNPLSCKKKKAKKPAENSLAASNKEKKDDSSPKSKGRKRKRSHRSKALAQTSAQ